MNYNESTELRDKIDKILWRLIHRLDEKRDKNIMGDNYALDRDRKKLRDMYWAELHDKKGITSQDYNKYLAVVMNISSDHFSDEVCDEIIDRDRKKSKKNQLDFLINIEDLKKEFGEFKKNINYQQYDQLNELSLKDLKSAVKDFMTLTTQCDPEINQRIFDDLKSKIGPILNLEPKNPVPDLILKEGSTAQNSIIERQRSDNKGKDVITRVAQDGSVKVNINANAENQTMVALPLIVRGSPNILTLEPYNGNNACENLLKVVTACKKAGIEVNIGKENLENFQKNATNAQKNEFMNVASEKESKAFSQKEPEQTSGVPTRRLR